MAISKEEYVQNISEPKRKRLAPAAQIKESAEIAAEGIVVTPENTVVADEDAPATTPTTARKGR